MKTQNGKKIFLQYLVKEVFCKNVAACNCMAKVFWKKIHFSGYKKLWHQNTSTKLFEHVMQHRAVQLISEEPLTIAFQFVNQLNKHKGNRDPLVYSHKMVKIRVET